jgi:hypothetical protein
MATLGTRYDWSRFEGKLLGGLFWDVMFDG